MRIVSRIVVVIGVIAVIAALGLMAYISLSIWGNMMSKLGSQAISPYSIMWGAFGLGTVGGFIAGLGLVMPKGKHKDDPKKAGAAA